MSRWPNRTAQERFWEKVNKTQGCWFWTSALFTEGYGQFWFENRLQPAHRVSYEWLVGAVPVGLEIDHLCRVRSCVNPKHLEPVTHIINVQRGQDGIKNRMKTHCPQGHEYTEDNIYWARHHTARNCRACTLKRRATERGIVRTNER